MFGAAPFAARPFAAARLLVTTGGITGAAALTLASFAGAALATLAIGGGAGGQIGSFQGVAAGSIVPLAVSFTPATRRDLSGGPGRLLIGGFDRTQEGG